MMTSMSTLQCMGQPTILTMHSDAKYAYQVSYQMCRYAVSVVWVLDSRYRVQKVWYGRTIIRSKYKLAYEVVT